MKQSIQEILKRWVHATCPDPKVRLDILNSIDKIVPLRRDYHFTIGAALTASRSAFLVHIHASELFFFGLTNEQARLAEVVDSEVSFLLDRPTSEMDATPVINLNRMQISDEDHLRFNAPINGSCEYDTAGQFVNSACLRLTALRLNGARNKSGGMNLYYYPPHLPTQATLQFKMSISNVPDRPAKRQIAAAFLRFTTRPDGLGTTVPLSNALGTLITLE